VRPLVASRMRRARQSRQSNGNGPQRALVPAPEGRLGMESRHPFPLPWPADVWAVTRLYGLADQCHPRARLRRSDALGQRCHDALLLATSLSVTQRSKPFNWAQLSRRRIARPSNRTGGFPASGSRTRPLLALRTVASGAGRLGTPVAGLGSRCRAVVL
jgi:hypothetical protein